jgi:hypothetical protein
VPRFFPVRLRLLRRLQTRSGLEYLEFFIQTLADFEVQYLCSALELELDLFKKEIVAVCDVPGGRQNSEIFS